MTAVTVAHLAAVLVAAIGAFTDWRWERIPNWLTFGAGGSALLGHGLAGGTGGLLHAGSGLLACGLVPAIMFYLPLKDGQRPMHGGDVKMFAALGALLGPFVGIECQLYALCFAAIVALVRLAWEGKLLRTLGNVAVLVGNVVRRADRRRPAPEALATVRLGVPIFLGTTIGVALNSPELLSWIP
ncbi:MAG: prepilin peptidase [Myxococcota bacterium]|nr:prepilin peptidase [Myxococcota bacterium]MDW8361071.1 prepilin peptidase [Myxococcales bacterium]